MKPLNNCCVFDEHRGREKEKVLKKFFATATLAIASFGAHATEAGKMEYCKNIGQISEIIMNARQHGVPISKLMEVGTMASKGDPYLEKLYQLTTLSAYNHPKFEAAEFQRKAVIDFSNEMATLCYNWAMQQ